MTWLWEEPSTPREGIFATNGEEEEEEDSAIGGAAGTMKYLGFLFQGGNITENRTKMMTPTTSPPSPVRVETVVSDEQEEVHVFEDGNSHAEELVLALGDITGESRETADCECDAHDEPKTATIPDAPKRGWIKFHLKHLPKGDEFLCNHCCQPLGRHGKCMRKLPFAYDDKDIKILYHKYCVLPRKRSDAILKGVNEEFRTICNILRAEKTDAASKAQVCEEQQAFASSALPPPPPPPTLPTLQIPPVPTEIAPRSPRRQRPTLDVIGGTPVVLTGKHAVESKRLDDIVASASSESGKSKDAQTPRKIDDRGRSRHNRSIHVDDTCQKVKPTDVTNTNSISRSPSQGGGRRTIITQHGRNGSSRGLTKEGSVKLEPASRSPMGGLFQRMTQFTKSDDYPSNRKSRFISNSRSGSDSQRPSGSSSKPSAVVQSRTKSPVTVERLVEQPVVSQSQLRTSRASIKESNPVSSQRRSRSVSRDRRPSKERVAKRSSSLQRPLQSPSESHNSWTGRSAACQSKTRAESQEIKAHTVRAARSIPLAATTERRTRSKSAPRSRRPPTAVPSPRQASSSLRSSRSISLFEASRSASRTCSNCSQDDASRTSSKRSSRSLSRGRSSDDSSRRVVRTYSRNRSMSRGRDGSQGSSVRSRSRSRDDAAHRAAATQRPSRRSSKITSSSSSSERRARTVFSSSPRIMPRSRSLSRDRKPSMQSAKSMTRSIANIALGLTNSKGLTTPNKQMTVENGPITPRRQRSYSRPGTPTSRRELAPPPPPPPPLSLNKQTAFRQQVRSARPKAATPRTSSKKMSSTKENCNRKSNETITVGSLSMAEFVEKNAFHGRPPSPATELQQSRKSMATKVLMTSTTPRVDNSSNNRAPIVPPSPRPTGPSPPGTMVKRLGPLRMEV